MTVDKFHIRVYYGDTDAAGVLYHAATVGFFERARTEWLRQRGVQQRQLAADGTFFAVRRLQVEYKKAARLDDLLEIETTIHRAGKTSAYFQQTMRLDGDDIATAEVQIVCVSGPPFRPCPFPEAVRAFFPA